MTQLIGAMGPDPSDRRVREDDVALLYSHLFCYSLLRRDDIAKVR